MNTEDAFYLTAEMKPTPWSPTMHKLSNLMDARCSPAPPSGTPIAERKVFTTAALIRGSLIQTRITVPGGGCGGRPRRLLVTHAPAGLRGFSATPPGFVAVVDLSTDLDIRGAYAQLAPLAQRPHRHVQLFGGFKLRRIAGNALTPQSRRVLFGMSFPHCRRSYCRGFPLSAVRGRDPPLNSRSLHEERHSRARRSSIILTRMPCPVSFRSSRSCWSGSIQRSFSFRGMRLIYATVLRSNSASVL
jgi:hypothetical protein